MFLILCTSAFPACLGGLEENMFQTKNQKYFLSLLSFILIFLLLNYIKKHLTVYANATSVFTIKSIVYYDFPATNRERLEHLREDLPKIKAA